MKHRSSVTTFAKALLSQAAIGVELEIPQIGTKRLPVGESFESLLDQVLEQRQDTLIKMAKAAIPPDDWTEIKGYIIRHYNAYGFSIVQPGSPHHARLFLTWLALVAVCALDDIGR
jgi:hypothetical protein